jgi:hypothetical protein
MSFTQGDWKKGSERRVALFGHVVDTLNRYCGCNVFVAQDDVTGPLVRHTPSNIHIGVRPSLPANPAKPFDLFVMHKHRFPMKADGSFNVSLLVKRIEDVDGRLLNGDLTP